MKKGDIIQVIHNCEVEEVNGNTIKAYDKERKLHLSLEGSELARYVKNGSEYNLTKKVTKTEIADLLIHSHGVVFTVEYIKQDNEHRTLRGYLTGVDGQLGRSYCVDLDVLEENKTRLVDHRTIKSLILKGTKYYVQ